LLLHTAQEVNEIKEEIGAQRDYEAIKVFWEGFKDVMNKATNLPDTGAARFAPLIEGLRAEFREWLSGLLERFCAALRALVEGLPTLEHIIPLWTESTQAWTASYNKTLPGVITTLDEIFRYDGELKTVLALIGRVVEISEFFKNLFLGVLFESFDIFGDIMENFRFFEVLEKYGKLWDEYVEWTKSVIAKLEENSEVFRDLFNLFRNLLQKLKQCVKAFKDSVTETRLMIEEVLRSSEVEKLLQDWKPAINKILEVLYEARQKVVQEDFSSSTALIKMISESKFKLDRENGELEAALPLLVPASNIRQLRTGLADINKLTQRRSIPYEDVYSEWFDSFYERRILPPFDGAGVVIDSQNYISFDGKLYQFAGKCKYLLAQDAIDGNFSVIISYSDVYERLITSITVVLKDHTVEVNSEYEVLLNDQKRELPLRYEDTVVKREGPNVVVTTGNGLTVYANPLYDTYIVNVNGYYFGKTQGVLGVYNNEQYNELMPSYGEHRNASLTDFVRSWEVSTDCKEEGNQALYERVARYRSPAYDYCAKYFKNKSAKYAAAFDEVDPKPYMELCLQDFGESPLEGKPNIHFCYTAAAYTTVAQLRGYDIEVPSACPGLLN